MTTEAIGPAIAEIARAVIRDPAYQEFEWTAISLVLRRQANAASISKVYGYVYLADGSDKVSRTGLDVLIPLCEPLVAAMASTDGGDPGFWKCLLQIPNGPGAPNVEFEYEDRTRWDVNPEDWDELPESIRPAFAKAAEAGIDFDELVEPMGGKYQDRYWPLTEAQVAEVEEAVGWELPDDLRRYFLEFGVAYAKGYVAFVGDDGETISFNTFYGAPGPGSHFSVITVAEEFAPLVNFGRGGAGIFFIDENVHVLFESHSAQPRKIAESFTDFCLHLKPIEE